MPDFGSLFLIILLAIPAGLVLAVLIRAYDALVAHLRQPDASDQRDAREVGSGQQAYLETDAHPLRTASRSDQDCDPRG
jgi:hypothetical protein